MEDHYVPTREELYAEVDRRFRAERPDAPARLSADSAADADHRARWLAIRGELLDQEANRIYWDAYPKAPVTLRPDDEYYEYYANAWNDIRARLLANQPVPPMAEGTPVGSAEAGLSEIRAKYYEALADIERIVPAGMHGKVRAAIDATIAEAVQASRDGRVDQTSGWTSEYVAVESYEGDTTDPWKVFYRAGARWSGDVFTPWIEWETSDPNIELEIDDSGPAPSIDP